MIYHINYSNNNFVKAQKLNTISAKKYNIFDDYFNFSPKDIDTDFYNKNQEILTQKTGGGYWLWKPYLILETLKKINYGDIVFYTDSGSVFVDNPKYLIDLISTFNQDIIPFELPFIETNYTKRDTFILMDCDYPIFRDSKHLLTGYIVIKKSDLSIDFFERFLKFASDERIVTDIDNTLGFPNYEGFIVHRHDQSIFSLLSKKYQLKTFRDPSQFGNYFIDDYPDSQYPQVIDSTRLRNKNLEYWTKKIKKISTIILGN